MAAVIPVALSVAGSVGRGPGHANDILNGMGFTLPPPGRRLADVQQKYSPLAIGTLTQSERTR